MNITYRQFKASDKKAVVELIKSLYREDPEGNPVFDEKINRTFTELTKHPDKGTIMIIEADSKIIGYSILINFWSNEYSGNILDIDELYIKSNYRGKGIGLKYIQYLIDNKFNNSVAVQLETMPSNNKARQLYERIGFKLSQSNHFIYDFEG